MRVTIMRHGPISTAVLLLVAATAPLRAQESRQPFTVVLDEEYSDAARDARSNRLDLFLPRADASGAAQKPPLVMFVHGGGWMHGSKLQHRPIGEVLASHGIAAAVINYRLATVARFPAQAVDCAAAFAWLHARAAEFGFDRERMFVMGHSAGGHLVSLLAVDETWLQPHGLDRTAIRGVASLSGVYDVRAPFELLQRVFGNQPRERARASPIVVAKHGAPPFFVRWGQHDMPGLPLSATLFIDRLRRLGVEVDAAELPGEDHVSYFVRMQRERDLVTEPLLRFVHAHGAPRPPAHEGTAGAGGR